MEQRGLMTDQLTVVKNVCPLDCPDTCSMLVTVQDGVAVELRGDPDHRFTRGFLCQKMARYLERVYSPDRLLYPMKRVGRKGEGRFERITWDQALDAIAERFAAIARSSLGPQAILPYSYMGTMGKLQSSSLDRRFFHRLGASKLDRSICASAGSVGYEYTLGRGRLGADPLAVPGCKFIVNWGSNTAHTNSHLWSLMIEARQRRRDDRDDRPLPEPDGRALGLAHPAAPRHRCRAGLGGDARPLARRPPGRRLSEPRHRSALSCFETASWPSIPPETVAAITGVDVATITTLAHRLAREQPSLIRLNYGMQRHNGGGMAVRTDRLHPGDRRLVALPRRRSAALDQRHLRFRHGPAHSISTWRRRARASST